MEFQAFRATEAEKSKLLEQRIRKAREGEARTRDAETLVSQKIEERLLGRNLHPFVKDLLYGPWHKFMVVLVLKEGPGSNAWKQAINTIDVLLWSIQSHEQPGDRQRLARELQQETVRIISDGLLFNRALESVIGELRESKHTQQTGGAYRAPSTV